MSPSAGDPLMHCAGLTAGQLSDLLDLLTATAVLAALKEDGQPVYPGAVEALPRKSTPRSCTCPPALSFNVK